MAAADIAMKSKFEQLPSLGEGASSSANQEGEQPANGSEWEGPPRRNTIDLNYMHRPPTILPNYGKRKGALKLKTNVPRVLLFDNVTQQTMLQVELSCLQSQRHKADRELSMQARSFMLRRQFKERYLKNLTKVFHDDDYWDFEREYFGVSSAPEAWPPAGQAKGGNFLPSLPNGRGVNLSGRQQINGALVGKNRPGRKRKMGAISNARWSAADANGIERKRVEASNGQRESSLPQIRISPPNSTPQDSPTSHLLHFSPRKKVGFRFQKTPSGVTRIFHAHDEEEQQEGVVVEHAGSDAMVTNGVDTAPLANYNTNDDNTSKENGDTTENTAENDGATDIPVVEEPEEKPRVVIKDRQKTNPFSKRPKPKEDSTLTAKPVVEEEPPREFPISTDQPTQDHRFKVLNRVLVKQEPPNDGYIELSPSFVREGPIKQLRHRIKVLRLTGRRSRDGSSRSRRENVSQGVTPVLSEDEHSASDGGQDEDDEAARAQKANEGLMRLGGV